MSVYRSGQRGSWIVKRRLLGITIRRATGFYDREKALQVERALVVLARKQRDYLIQSFAAGRATGADVLNCERANRESFIYVIQNTETLRLKIGVTTNLKQRVASLQHAAGSSMRVLVSFSGDQFDEQKLLKQFAAHRVRGEWFQPSPELMEFVNNKLAVSCGS